MIVMYMDKKLEDMTKEELIEAVLYLGQQNKELHACFNKVEEIHKLEIKYIKSNRYGHYD